MQNDQQLSLPYAAIEKVVSRQLLRSNKNVFTQTARASFTMPLNKISIREGFNSRVIYEGIKELADDMFLKGQGEPLVLDILPDLTGIVDEGNRRIRAFWLNLELGRIKEDHPVEFYPNKTSVTELDRMVRQMTSNTNFKKELKPYEQATVAWNVKNLYSDKPLSHEEVGNLLHVSRQTVDNLIKIHTADDSLRQEMITADMNLKDCLATVNRQKDLQKQTDKKEQEAAQSAMYITQDPKDINADDIAASKALDGNPDEDDDLPFIEETEEEYQERLQQEAIKKQVQDEKELEHLYTIADEVKVAKLSNHLDKKLAAAVNKTISEDLVNPNGGEVIPVTKTVLFLKRGTIITDNIILQLKDNKVDIVFVYKAGCEPIMPSVFTEPVATKEKDKYDSMRPEIAQIQNIIKLSDKLEFQVSKLDVPDGVKADISNIVKWIQNDAMPLRDWIHSNKKQNKLR